MKASRLADLKRSGICCGRFSEADRTGRSRYRKDRGRTFRGSLGGLVALCAGVSALPCERDVHRFLLLSRCRSKDNRITLSENAMDPFGLPQAKLHWRVGDEDLASFRGVAAKFAAMWKASRLRSSLILCRKMNRTSAEQAAQRRRCLSSQWHDSHWHRSIKGRCQCRSPNVPCAQSLCRQHGDISSCRRSKSDVDDDALWQRSCREVGTNENLTSCVIACNQTGSSLRRGSRLPCPGSREVRRRLFATSRTRVPLA